MEILTHKYILDNKMSWNDIVKYHLPLSTSEDIDSILIVHSVVKNMIPIKIK